MFKMNSLLACLVFAVVVACAVPAPAHASGSTLTTQDSNQPGQVLVRNEDGTVYLTTETVPGSNNTVYTKETRWGGILSNVNITIPDGFAKDFSGLLNGVLSFVMVIAALLVFFYLIWGAFDWITSGGDKGATEKARGKIQAAVVGLIIVASAFAILTLALNFLGFSNLNDVFQSAGTIQGGASSSRGTSELGRINEASPSSTQK